MTKLVMLSDVTHSITLATSSPGYFMPVKSDQVKMLPSVKCTGHHWSTYQFWYSIANASWVPWSQAVSKMLKH